MEFLIGRGEHEQRSTELCDMIAPQWLRLGW
jgi:hypothetical protein